MPIYPIGIIDEPTSNGARFSIPPQNGRPMPKPGDPVTVYNQINPPGGPLARMAGEITETSATTGAYIMRRQEIDPTWPEEVQPFGMGNPVYLATGPGSLIPDHSRAWASPEEYALMVELAKDHERQAGIPPAAGTFRRVPQDEAEDEEDHAQGR